MSTHIQPTTSGLRVDVHQGAEWLSFRAKLLSCSYIIQANRARFNQNSVNPTGPLCKRLRDLKQEQLCLSLHNSRTQILSQGETRKGKNLEGVGRRRWWRRRRFINTYIKKKREERRKGTLCVCLSLCIFLYMFVVSSLLL